MTLSCITLVLPAAFHSSRERISSAASEKLVSNGSGLFATRIGEIVSTPDSGLLLLSRCVPSSLSPPSPRVARKLRLNSLPVAFLRGTAIILFIVYLAYLYFQLKSHADLFLAEETDEEPEEPAMGLWSSCFALLAVTVLTAFCADILVASIDETCEQFNVPKAFVGLILLPLVGNAGE
jgi:Ca2+:H+ antiporter